MFLTPAERFDFQKLSASKWNFTKRIIRIFFSNADFCIKSLKRDTATIEENLLKDRKKNASV